MTSGQRYLKVLKHDSSPSFLPPHPPTLKNKRSIIFRIFELNRHCSRVKRRSEKDVAGIENMEQIWSQNCQLLLFPLNWSTCTRILPSIFDPVLFWFQLGIWSWGQIWWLTWLAFWDYIELAGFKDEVNVQPHRYYYWSSQSLNELSSNENFRSLTLFKPNGTLLHVQKNVNKTWSVRLKSYSSLSA